MISPSSISPVYGTSLDRGVFTRLQHPGIGSSIHRAPTACGPQAIHCLSSCRKDGQSSNSPYASLRSPAVLLITFHERSGVRKRHTQCGSTGSMFRGKTSVSSCSVSFGSSVRLTDVWRLSADAVAVPDGRNARSKLSTHLKYALRSFI